MSEPGLLDALFHARAKIPVLPKGETARVQTQSGGYTYHYASLEATKEIVDPILREHGLLWKTKPSGTSENPTLVYQMAHVPTGEQDEGEMPLLLSKGDSQAHGSAITYGRRYALWAYLDLVGEDDDDGQAASGYHRESRASTSGTDMRDRAKGLTDGAINAARRSVGLPILEKPWGSLVNIPAEKADEFAAALDAARAAQ